MKKTIVLLILLWSVHFCVNAQNAIEFVKNKGQWQAPFEYKATTPNGDVFFKKNAFRFLLSDFQNHDKIHGVHHGWKQGEQILKYHSYEMKFLNANEQIEFTEEKKQKHYYNYFLGNNPANWKSEIYPVLAVNYHNLYNNIDAHVYSDNGKIKYDFIVHPTGDYAQIKMNYEGLEALNLKDNHLILKTSLGEQQESIPSCYQFIDGEKIEIKCKYILREGIVSFEIGKNYNKNVDLIIDPTLTFCSFTGSNMDNWGFTATYDSSGNFYAGGVAVNYQDGTIVSSGPNGGTGSYPFTTGVIQTSYGGGTVNSSTSIGVATDITITKFNSAGTAVIYATYLGGSDNEQPHSLIVDHNDNLIIAGRTSSLNYPRNSAIPTYDTTLNGGTDIVITKINPSGTQILGSTYVGGTGFDGVNINIKENVISGLKHNYADDARSEVIVDDNNNIYLAGCTSSSDFPSVHPPSVTNTYGGGQDGVLIKLTPNCSNLLWSVFIGGSANDAAYVLSFNKKNQNELFVAGGTQSSSLANTSTSGVLHASNQGGIDGFLLKYNTVTMAQPTATFIGTSSYDQVYGVQTDDSNNVYIVGQTNGAYPVSTGVYSNANSSQFLAKIKNDLSTQLFSTVFGNGTQSSVNISINAFLVDRCNNVYVSGWGGDLGGFNVAASTTTGLPTSTSATNLPIKSTTDGDDFYFIVFSKDFQNLVYATFFGQTGGGGEHVDGGTSRFDENGVIYQAICANCAANPQVIFPTTSNAIFPTNPSDNCNLAALKIKFDLQDPDADAVVGGITTGCAPLPIVFQNNSASATSFFWDFGDGTTSTLANPPSHNYNTPGTYNVMLVASNPNACQFSSDTDHITIIVKSDSIHANFSFVRVDTCNPFTATFNNTSTNNLPVQNTTYLWDFGDGTTFAGINPPLHTYSNTGTYIVKLTMTDTNACNNPSVITHTVDYSTSYVSAGFTAPDSVCMPALISFIDQSQGAATYAWSFGDGQSSSQSSPNHNYNNPGNYQIILIAGNPNSCNKLDTVTQNISIFSAPTADFSWMPNPPTPNTPNVFTNYSTGATKYEWNFGDNTFSNDKDPIHVFEKDGEYNVCLTAMNNEGCKDTACKKVRGVVVPLAEVPSGFSPNGDGVNDVVYVRGYGIEKMTFRVFNRWGEKIFESLKKADGWDGRYKGVMQEMEAYQYTLSVTFFDGSTSFKKGSITLLK